MSKKCPIDGCGSTHDTWGGVAVHMWKKQDDAHAEFTGKDEALEWLAENGHMAGEDPRSSPASSSGADPTMGSGEVAADGGKEHTLPCKHESFDTSDVKESQTWVENGERKTLAQCDECGGEWEVTL